MMLEKTYLTTINAILEQQGMPVIDMTRPAYVLLPRYDDKQDDFKQACRSGLVMNFGNPSLNTQTVQNILAELQAQGKKAVTAFAIFPESGEEAGGYYAITEPEYQAYVFNRFKSYQETITSGIKSVQHYRHAKKSNASGLNN